MTAKRKTKRRREGPGLPGEEEEEEELKLRKRWDRWEGESEWNKIKGEWGFVHSPLVFFLFVWMC